MGAPAKTQRCPACGSFYPADYQVCPKDARRLEAIVADDDGLIGTVLADTFCLVGTVGEGGMGKVYEAEHVRLPRKYAVKILAPQYARDPEAIGRFEREAQAAARVVHPNVLDVIDVVRASDGRPCLVTELLVGEELAALIARERKVSVLRAVTLCRQVCRGLAAAHRERIVHRDLKPENLFVTRDDRGVEQVKILDFGVAKLADGSNLTRTGFIVGTPVYMAPEQARGTAVDGRTDLYSLGAVLYHLLTGRLPFEGDEPAKVLLQVVHEHPPRPRAIDRAIPEALDALVMRLMSHDPADRHATAEELERELEGLDGSDERLARDTLAMPSPLERATSTPSPVAAPPATPIAAPVGTPTATRTTTLSMASEAERYAAGVRAIREQRRVWLLASCAAFVASVVTAAAAALSGSFAAGLFAGLAAAAAATFIAARATRPAQA